MKKRLDVLVYEKGFCDSREKAKAIIMSGQVFVNGQKVTKAMWIIKRLINAVHSTMKTQK